MQTEKNLYCLHCTVVNKHIGKLDVRVFLGESVHNLLP